MIVKLSDGAPARSRTADLLITNQLLYQLSYKGIHLIKQLVVYILNIISSTLFFYLKTR